MQSYVCGLLPKLGKPHWRLHMAAAWECVHCSRRHLPTMQRDRRSCPHAGSPPPPGADGGIFWLTGGTTLFSSRLRPAALGLHKLVAFRMQARTLWIGGFCARNGSALPPAGKRFAAPVCPRTTAQRWRAGLLHSVQGYSMACRVTAWSPGTADWSQRLKWATARPGGHPSKLGQRCLRMPRGSRGRATIQVRPGGPARRGAARRRRHASASVKMAADTDIHTPAASCRQSHAEQLARGKVFGVKVGVLTWALPWSGPRRAKAFGGREQGRGSTARPGALCGSGLAIGNRQQAQGLHANAEPTRLVTQMQCTPPTQRCEPARRPS